MKRLLTIGALVLTFAAVSFGVVHAQTDTPASNAASATASPTPSPADNGSVNGTSDTTPGGVPRTGFGTL